MMLIDTDLLCLCIKNQFEVRGYYSSLRGDVKIHWLQHSTAVYSFSYINWLQLAAEYGAAANLYRKSYTQLLNAAAFWLQPAVMNFDVSPYRDVCTHFRLNRKRKSTKTASNWF